MFLERVLAAEKPGIVYVSTRKYAKEIAGVLRAEGIRADAYHAGMRAKERTATQEGFMSDNVEVMVATTAFGMGVDKPNVRFVFHYGISDSIDTYYQEIGRAGRAGKPAKAILFYRPEDLVIHRFFAGGGKVTVVEDPSNEPFLLNSRVRHGVWGEGMVQRYEGDTMTVLFDDIGYKTLAVPFVLETGAVQAM